MATAETTTTAGETRSVPSVQDAYAELSSDDPTGGTFFLAAKSDRDEPRGPDRRHQRAAVVANRHGRGR